MPLLSFFRYLKRKLCECSTKSNSSKDDGRDHGPVVVSVNVPPDLTGKNTGDGTETTSSEYRSDQDNDEEVNDDEKSREMIRGEVVSRVPRVAASMCQTTSTTTDLDKRNATRKQSQEKIVTVSLAYEQALEKASHIDAALAAEFQRLCNSVLSDDALSSVAKKPPQRKKTPLVKAFESDCKLSDTFLTFAEESPAKYPSCYLYATWIRQLLRALSAYSNPFLCSQFITWDFRNNEMAHNLLLQPLWKRSQAMYAVGCSASAEQPDMKFPLEILVHILQYYGQTEKERRPSRLWCKLCNNLYVADFSVPSPRLCLDHYLPPDLCKSIRLHIVHINEAAVNDDDKSLEKLSCVTQTLCKQIITHSLAQLMACSPLIREFETRDALCRKRISEQQRQEIVPQKIRQMGLDSDCF